MGDRREQYNAWRRKRREWFRAILRRYKVLKGCADCGYNAHHAALEFDHLPGYAKKCNIITLLDSGRKAMKAELAKCEVVCSNCHSMAHKRKETVTSVDELKALIENAKS